MDQQKRLRHRRAGWDIRLKYYERMLRSMLTMLEDSLRLMKADDMPDVVCRLTQVALALEDTWALVASLRTEEMDQARRL
jgi:hypothetical protein